jgi:hypothetical protein
MGLLRACALAAFFAGCAVGTDAVTGDPPGGGDEAGTTVDASTDRSTGGHDSGGGGDGGRDGGGDGGGGDGGGDGGGGGIACTSPNACSNGREIGTVSGDTGSGTQSTQGTTSEWLRVRVSEDDSSPFASSMKLNVTLTSPAGTNFDLYVYADYGNDAVECNTIKGQSTGVGNADSVDIEWGETGTFANGSDDDRTVTIEVRHVSGTCKANESWSLQVKGN